jgi:hypothetical protein
MATVVDFGSKQSTRFCRANRPMHDGEFKSHSPMARQSECRSRLRIASIVPVEILNVPGTAIIFHSTASSLFQPRRSFGCDGVFS